MDILWDNEYFFEQFQLSQLPTVPCHKLSDPHLRGLVSNETFYRKFISWDYWNRNRFWNDEITWLSSITDLIENKNEKLKKNYKNEKQMSNSNSENFDHKKWTEWLIILSSEISKTSEENVDLPLPTHTKLLGISYTLILPLWFTFSVES